MAEVWLDYSGYRPDPRHLRRLGVKGVVRYLSEPVPATSWKRISHAEKNAILAAGLDLILNWEWYEGRMLEGASAGWHDGKMAMAQAKSLGYPKGASIYFSHDTGARHDSAILAYLKAAQDAMGDFYHVDVYSGIGVVDLAIAHKHARYGWQTIAWSYGRVGRAHLYQDGNFWFNRMADENHVLHRPLGSWRDHGTVAPAKPLPWKPKPTPTKGVKEHLYTVQSNDTLPRVALRNHTTVKEILRLNPGVAKTAKAGKSAYIKKGWVIYLPGAPVHHDPPKVKKYRVHSGDTLSAIAHEFHTSVSQLVKWNSHLIKNPNLIRIGWIIRVG